MRSSAPSDWPEFRFKEKVIGISTRHAPDGPESLFDLESDRQTPATTMEIASDAAGEGFPGGPISIPESRRGMDRNNP